MSDRVTKNSQGAENSGAKKRLFINSLSLYICSFLAVKIVTILYKLVIAFVFKIKPGLIGFRLFGQNPPDSPVWRKMSVIAYFSADIIVPLILAAAVFLLWIKYHKKKTIWIAGLLWVGFSAILSLFGGIMAGIVAKTNQFFFLQWLLIPHFKMMIIAITMVPALIVSGIFYNILFMITKPYSGFGEGTKQNKKILVYSVLLPVLAGSFILGVASIPAIDLYCALELASAVLLALPVLFYIKIEKPPRNSTGYSGKLYRVPLIASAAGAVLFFAANLILRQ